MPASVPEVLAAWMRPFQGYFTAAVWRHALVLVAGAVLAPGRRTVTAALRVMGLGQAPGFAVHHRVLSHGRWSSRAVAHRLLLLLVAAFVPEGPVVVGLDDTIERRWGARIRARGIYRDPVRSSHGHFVKASGLRWLCVMLLAPVPWAGCVWGLPFLTVLAPSERLAPGSAAGGTRSSPTGRARRCCRPRAGCRDGGWSRWPTAASPPSPCCATSPRVCAWSPGCASTPACASHPRRAAQARPGRPPVKGARLPSLAERLADPATSWRRVASTAGTGAPSAASTSPPAPRSGTTPACGCRSAGCSCATRAARRSRRPSCAPTRRPTRWTSCAGSSAAGAPRPPSRRPRRSPRRGNPAPVVRPGHPAHHAGAARAVLARDALGEAPRRRARACCPKRVRWYPKPLPTFSDALALVRRESVDRAGFRSLTRTTGTCGKSRPICSTAFCSSPVARRDTPTAPRASRRVQSQAEDKSSGQSTCLGRVRRASARWCCG